MKRRTFVRPEAQTDIREAATWYEGREIGLGIRFMGEIRASLQHIADNPSVSNRQPGCTPRSAS
jgi:hypothetical protein